MNVTINKRNHTQRKPRTQRGKQCNESKASESSKQSKRSNRRSKRANGANEQKDDEATKQPEKKRTSILYKSFIPHMHNFQNGADCQARSRDRRWTYPKVERWGKTVSTRTRQSRLQGNTSLTWTTPRPKLTRKLLGHLDSALLTHAHRSDSQAKHAHVMQYMHTSCTFTFSHTKPLTIMEKG